MLRILIFLTLITPASIACELSGPSQIVISDQEKAINTMSELSFKKCTKNQIKLLRASLSDFQGVLSEKILIAEGIKAKLINTIEFKKVSELLNDKHNLPKDWRFIEAKILGRQKSYFNIPPKNIVNIHCDNCSSTGKKNIKIELSNPLSGKKRLLWAQATVGVKTKVLVSKHNVKAFSGALSRSNFKQESLYVAHPEHFFTNTEKLPYYKLNKSIELGSRLKFHDMSPMSLVKPGHPVKLKLKSGTLRLSSKAIPIRAGKFGEVIQLRNPNTKKIIIGKVTDFNEVEVEL